ncbi:MAG: DoxX family membrane protein [Ardenticatenia bacterium]|nr:DoxX family membrane protein [Ardenticatenia bacterium]
MVKPMASPWPVHDPPFLTFLFSDVRSGWLWLVLRLYVGWKWLEAGLQKWTPGWLEQGVALERLLERALATSSAEGPFIAFGWYRDAISYVLHTDAYVWLARLVVVAEIVVGIGLIAGVLVGVTSLLAAFMSWNAMMVGVGGANVLLLPLALLLVFAWKVAGYIGCDYFFLPRLLGPSRQNIPQQHTVTRYPPYLSGRM